MAFLSSAFSLSQERSGLVAVVDRPTPSGGGPDGGKSSELQLNQQLQAKVSLLQEQE